MAGRRPRARRRSSGARRGRRRTRAESIGASGAVAAARRSVGSVTGLLIVVSARSSALLDARRQSMIPNPNHTAVTKIATADHEIASTGPIASIDQVAGRSSAVAGNSPRATRMRRRAPALHLGGIAHDRVVGRAPDDAVAALERGLRARARRARPRPGERRAARADRARGEMRQRAREPVLRRRGRRRAGRGSPGVARSSRSPASWREAASRAAGFSRSSTRRSDFELARAATHDRAPPATRIRSAPRASARREFDPIRHDQLRGRGRRGGPHVRGEIRERDVDLVPDPAHDRQRVRHDRAHDPLVVERPEVLHGAAAARDDRERRAPRRPVPLPRESRRASRSAGAPGRSTPPSPRPAPGRRPGRRGPAASAGRRPGRRPSTPRRSVRDDRDDARTRRQRPLPLRREQPLRRQLRLELLEPDREVPHPATAGSSRRTAGARPAPRTRRRARARRPAARSAAGTAIEPGRRGTTRTGAVPARPSA